MIVAVADAEEDAVAEDAPDAIASGTSCCGRMNSAMPSIVSRTLPAGKGSPIPDWNRLRRAARIIGPDVRDSTLCCKQYTGRRMSFTNGIGSSTQPAGTASAGPSVGTAGAARVGAAPRNSWPVSSAAGEIATDAAMVSLAGAMISQAGQGSDVRFDEVAALRQSIEAGTYRVSSAAFADKLISVLQR